MNRLVLRNCRSTGIQTTSYSRRTSHIQPAYWCIQIMVKSMICVGEKIHHDDFDFRWPQMMVKPQTVSPTKTINILSRILELLILYARHRIISKKLATSNESAPESMQQPRWWMILMKGDHGRCGRCVPPKFGCVSNHYSWLGCISKL